MRQVRTGSADSTRGLPPPARRPRGRLLSLQLGILLAALSVLLGLAVFFALFSGLLRWVLLILLLLGGGWIAGKFLLARTTEVTPLSRTEPDTGLRRNRLRSLSLALRRGNRGLRYSQLQFAISLRDAFLARARSAIGFQGPLRELSRHLELLRPHAVDEEVIRFVRWVTRLEASLSEALSSPDEMFPGGPPDFAEKMEGMLHWMEGWP